jgi:hypothetical protein
MKTGMDAFEDGLYFSQCCGYRNRFAKNQTFTRCPKCSRLAVWELVDEAADEVIPEPVAGQSIPDS